MNWYYGESVYGKLFEMTSLPVEIAVVLMMTMIPLNFSFQIYKKIIIILIFPTNLIIFYGL